MFEDNFEHDFEKKENISLQFTLLPRIISIRRYIETCFHRHQQSHKYFDTDSVKNLEARNETNF